MSTRETDFNSSFIRNQAVHSYKTRFSIDFHLSFLRTDWGKQTFTIQQKAGTASLLTSKTLIFYQFLEKLETFLKDFN